MAPAKTLYVKDKDIPLWGRFETAVKEFQAADSVSALVSEAMRLYIGQFGDQGDGLYVAAPDEDPGAVTFGDRTHAILSQHGQSWCLFLDEEVYGNSADTYELSTPTSDVLGAVAEAREHLRHVADWTEDDLDAVEALEPKELAASLMELADAIDKLPDSIGPAKASAKFRAQAKRLATE